MIQNSHSEKILLVGENLNVRTGVCQILDQADQRYDIIEADSGLDAISKLRKGAFGLLIIDARMSTTSGVQFIDEVRSNLKLKIPIIAISGNDTLKNNDLTVRQNASNQIKAKSPQSRLVELVKAKLKIKDKVKKDPILPNERD